MEKKKSIIPKILKGILIVILAIVLTINTAILIQSKTNPDKVPNIFGYKPFIVLSGSMETEIYVGDLVFAKIVDPSTLNVNDIIAFRDSEDLVTTHRIIGVSEENGDRCFKTKGDNNNTEDEGQVCSAAVEGKYVGKIPKVGNALIFIQQPMGFVIMMMTIFIVCVFIYLISNRRLEKKMSDEDLKAFEEFKKARQQDKKEK